MTTLQDQTTPPIPDSPENLTPEHLPELPPEPELHPESSFYFGWLMLPVSLVMVCCTLPGQTVVVSMFNSAFCDALGLSLKQLGTAYLIGTLAAAFPLRRIGRLSDTLGPRITTALVTVGLTLGCLVISRSFNAVALTLGFFLIRLFGQGSMGMLSSHLLALWFERRLATVESIKHAGFGAACMAVPPVVVWLIAGHGWRNAYAILGIAVCVLILPIVLTIFRNKPEDIGQHLDNEPPGEHKRWQKIHKQHTQPEVPANFTLPEARSTLTFWALMLPGMLSGLVGTAMIFHIQPILEHANVENYEQAGAAAASAWGGAMLISTIISGPIADKFSARVLIPIASLMLALSFIVMGIASSAMHASISMATFGLSQGLYTASFGPAVARFFGRPHHGEIRGFVTTLFVAGTATGPFLIADGAQRAGGDFGPAFFVSAAFALALGALATRAIRPPQPTN